MSESEEGAGDAPTQEHAQEGTDREALRQERGALIFTGCAVLFILVVGMPCFCFFGGGLLSGFQSLRTGEYNNPARQKKFIPRAPNAPGQRPNRRAPRRTEPGRPHRSDRFTTPRDR